MKQWTMVGLLALAVGLVTGCEWSSGGGASDFNDRWNFVNFSGVYRSIIDDTPTISDGTGTPEEEVSVSNEKIAEGDGVATAFAGSLDNTDIVPGSVTITTPGFSFRDNDGDGNLTGTPSGSGSIVYGTGAWTLDFAGSALGDGVTIRASYVYVEPATPAPGAGNGGGAGGEITSLTVIQEGQRLSVIDNLGGTYEGNLGSIRSSGGVDQDDGILVGSDIIAQFSVQGTTSAGVAATITGIFTGAINTIGDTLNNRTMEGTFIEEGTGVTGEVLAAAPSIGISQPTITIPGNPSGTADTTTPATTTDTTTDTTTTP